MVAKCWASVGMHFEPVFGPGRIRIRSFVGSRAGKGNKFVTSFVHDKTAYLALKSLFSKTPNKVLAMATESRLLKKSWYKFMIFDVIDVLLF